MADPPRQALEALAPAYAALRDAAPLELCLATYFGRPDADALRRLVAAPVAELHLDLVRAPGLLDDAVRLAADGDVRLSLGLVDGRNVWRSDPDAVLRAVDTAAAVLGPKRVTLAGACSFLHVPYTSAREERLDPELRSWLAFAGEKLRELALLATAAGLDAAGRDGLLGPAREAVASRRRSPRVQNRAVRDRLSGLDGQIEARREPLAERARLQAERLGLPELPTTTIGSFPQTAEIRRARRDHRAGQLDDAAYQGFLEREIASTIEAQERLGLDVLVHGEPERSDMVEYFGEQLAGFALTDHGWVQSYGSRCVRPPILYGDVSRAGPMTVDTWRYAQSRTARPVKGMLTGPVTILQWSFVRDDQPRSETCTQIALALRDEVLDLEGAGAAVVQVDEPALREGLPLRVDEHAAYLRWAVDCFRLVVLGRPPRHPGAHPHVLRRARRRPRAARAHGRRRRVARGLALAHGGARRARRDRLPGGGRARRLRHPLAAGAERRRDRRPPGTGRDPDRARTALGQPRLRPQDPPLGRGRARAPRPRRGRPGPPLSRERLRGRTVRRAPAGSSLAAPVRAQ